MKENKEKQIKISESLFINLIKYHLLEQTNVEIEEKIKSNLLEKMESIEKRNLYSNYKDNSLTTEQREKARRKYLNKIGLNDDWRW